MSESNKRYLVRKYCSFDKKIRYEFVNTGCLKMFAKTRYVCRNTSINYYFYIGSKNQIKDGKVHTGYPMIDVLDRVF